MPGNRQHTALEISSTITENKQLYFFVPWQSYVCGKKNAFFGKRWTFQESERRYLL